MTAVIESVSAKCPYCSYTVSIPGASCKRVFAKMARHLKEHGK